MVLFLDRSPRNVNNNDTDQLVRISQVLHDADTSYVFYKLWMVRQETSIFQTDCRNSTIMNPSHWQGLNG